MRRYDAAFRKLPFFLSQHKPQEMSLNLTLSFAVHFRIQTWRPVQLLSQSLLWLRFLSSVFTWTLMILLHINFSLMRKTQVSLSPWHSILVPYTVLLLASGVHVDHCPSINWKRQIFSFWLWHSGLHSLNCKSYRETRRLFSSSLKGNILLSPHAKFLAKYEDPRKIWKLWTIVPLLQDPSLCPLHTLRSYLESTHSWTSVPCLKGRKVLPSLIMPLYSRSCNFLRSSP